MPGDIDPSRAVHVIRAIKDGLPAPNPEACQKIQTERQVLTEAAQRALAGPRSMFAKTGNVWLDEITGGIEPGLNWVVAAQSSFGKSTFASAIADENLGLRKVLIGSTEDVAHLYGRRILCRRTRVNAKRFKWGRLHQSERDDVEKAISNLRELPLYIDWNGATAEQIARDISGYTNRDNQHVRGVVEQFGIEIVLVDWLGKIPTEKRCDSPRDKVAHAYDCISRAAKQINCALVVFSQVTPTQGAPTMDWVRDSKDVAHLADVVVLGICKDDREDDGTLKSRERKFLGAKVKDEEPGRSVPTGWDNDSASFQPLRKTTHEEPPDGLCDDLCSGFDNQSRAAGDTEEELWP